MRLVLVLGLAAGSAGLAGSPLLAQRVVSCTLGLDATNTDLPIPTLAPPPGASVASSGTARRGSGTTYRCSVRYGIVTSAAAIADHVNAQMTTMGWTPAGRAEEAALVLTRYTGSSSAGMPLSAVTVVASVAGTPYHDVAVHIVRLDVTVVARASLPPLVGRAGGGGAAARGDDASLKGAIMGLLRTAPPASGGAESVEGSSLPTGFPGELLPKGSDIRASSSDDTWSTVVGAAPAFTVFEIPVHVAGLHKSGWAGQAPAGGLTLSASTAISRPIELCRRTEAATLSFVPLLSGGFAVRIIYSNKSGVPCANPLLLGRMADLTPILIPPATASIEGSFAGGPNGSDSQMRVQTGVEPAAMVKELSSQLVKGGWNVSAPLGAGDVMMIRARCTLPGGEPVTALVLVMPVGTPSQLNLWLHVARHRF